MPPLKVLYIIGTLDIGGSETQLVELVRRLDRRRFAPMVCCLSHGGPLIETLIGEGVTVEVIGFRGFRIFRQPHKVAIQLYRLIRFVRRAQPILLHGFLFWAYVLGAYAGRLAGVPIVVASRRSLGLFKADKPHFLLMERLANRMTDLIVANAEAVKADAILREGLPSSQIRVVYNGIESRLYDVPPDSALRSSLGAGHEAKIIGVIANLIHYKGHRLFLHACELLRQRDPAFAVLLIGDGPCRPELERLVKDLKLESEVKFLGTRRDVPHLLSVVDIVVLPSLQEGFPNAILEAMAAGKPVVATRVGGVPELIVHEETGLLVPPGDAQALAEAILTLFGDPGRAVAMGRAGRNRVVKKFGMDRMVLETQQLYEELLAAKGDR